MQVKSTLNHQLFCLLGHRGMLSEDNYDNPDQMNTSIQAAVSGVNTMKDVVTSEGRIYLSTKALYPISLQRHFGRVNITGWTTVYFHVLHIPTSTV